VGALAAVPRWQNPGNTGLYLQDRCTDLLNGRPCSKASAAQVTEECAGCSRAPTGPSCLESKSKLLALLLFSDPIPVHVLAGCACWTASLPSAFVLFPRPVLLSCGARDPAPSKSADARSTLEHAVAASLALFVPAQPAELAARVFTSLVSSLFPLLLFIFRVARAVLTTPAPPVLCVPPRSGPSTLTLGAAESGRFSPRPVLLVYR
jgi:hypothetical protein